MFKAIALFGFKKSSKPFKDYYKSWFKTLKNVLLPQLHNAMSSSSTSSPILLASHVEVIHRHFLNYYETLDLAASNDVAQVLYPDWRTPFEIPFLWLGDLHPYLFINLLRSFIGDSENDPEDMFDPEKQNWHVVMAWKSPGKRLTNRVDQIECGLRLMVPALAARAREAQAAFVKKVAAEWGNQRVEMNGVVAEAAARERHAHDKVAREGRNKEKEGGVAEEAARGIHARDEVAREGWRKEDMRGVVVEAARVEMEELVGVFVDANRLRRSVLSDILSVTDVYQAAVFLEALAQFLVGFRNRELLSQFDKSSLEL
ncbi:protein INAPERTURATE POLLEN1 [Lycium ferocissimum]|uniref:protein INAPERTURATE POLLEN1 n=1 Tax=Lycium ferocissimum TaxID=112874 RepID=UPI0028168F5D|nr:protein INAPERTURATE POLLEN1 [Lycium ferocissimum]